VPALELVSAKVPDSALAPVLEPVLELEPPVEHKQPVVVKPAKIRLATQIPSF